MSHKAFVIMPLSKDFNDIYEMLIRESLEEAGYEVYRSDDIMNQQNIIKDIVSSLASSELVVADLTTSNPNVYYELGIAHAMRKKTILLAQELGEIPFDLRPYRILVYGTHFAKFQEAKNELLAIASNAIDDNISFSNPVSDFACCMATSTCNFQFENNDENGLFDYLIMLEDGTKEINQILLDVVERTNVFNGDMDHTTKEMKFLENSSTKRKRESIQEFSGKLKLFGNFISEKVLSYKEKIEAVRSGSMYLLKLQAEVKNVDEEQIKNISYVAATVIKAAESGLDGLSGMIFAMKSWPKIEKNFNRAMNYTVLQLEQFAACTKEFIEMYAAIKKECDSILLNLHKK